ncbi:MAG: helix-turn-helix domain-containing protein [Deltaproteobacteria bacterium]|nr:helix-turn-helix domain-containing protein [Deltaproteobacteria bacterium]
MTPAVSRIADRWLTLEEAGAALKLKDEAVIRLIRKGDIYGVKVGKEWRVDLLSIESLLESKRSAARVALAKLKK